MLVLLCLASCSRGDALIVDVSAHDGRLGHWLLGASSCLRCRGLIYVLISTSIFEAIICSDMLRSSQCIVVWKPVIDKTQPIDRRAERISIANARLTYWKLAILSFTGTFISSFAPATCNFSLHTSH